MRVAQVCPGMRAPVLVIGFCLALVMFPQGVRANPVPVGACCLPDGTCEVWDRLQCEAMGGTYLGDDIWCEPDPCIGACCFPSGECMMLNPQLCAQYGVFLGYETACDPCNPCVLWAGACCLPDGSCVVESYYECCLAGGEMTMGDECEPNPCGGSPTEEESWGRIKSRYRD